MEIRREIWGEVAKLWPLARRALGGDEELASIALYGSGAVGEEGAAPIFDRSDRPHFIKGVLQRIEEASQDGRFTYRDQASLAAYLKQALRYVVLEIFRAKNASAGLTRVSLSAVFWDEEADPPIADPAPGALEQLCRNETAQELHHQIWQARETLSAALSELLDVVMGIVGEEDLDGAAVWQEAARRLGLEPNTVYQRKHQLRARLAELLNLTP